MNCKLKTEEKALEEKLKFKPDQKEVWHFHPIAFVEQMKMQGGIWHDPVLNPQLNKYSWGGNIKPYNGSFGYVRPALHSGIDIFAVTGTPVYSCMEGIVIRAGLAGKGGKAVTIKIKFTSDFIQQMNSVNYSLVYADKGEVMGAGVKETDSIYLIYIHLSEFKCKKGDKVEAGDLFALAGVTGNANKTRGPHVHFEIGTVANPSGTGVKCRINPARAINLNSYNTKEQDEANNYKYYNNGTKKKV